MNVSQKTGKKTYFGTGKDALFNPLTQQEKKTATCRPDSFFFPSAHFSLTILKEVFENDMRYCVC